MTPCHSRRFPRITGPILLAACSGLVPVFPMAPTSAAESGPGIRIQAASSAVIAEGSGKPAMRQCHAFYFNLQHSCWFGVDCMVPATRAHVGVFTLVEVPDMGTTRGWITAVYQTPRLNVPTVPAEPVPLVKNEAVIDLDVPEGLIVTATVDGTTVEATHAQGRFAIGGLRPDTAYKAVFRAEAPEAEDALPVVVTREIEFMAGDVVRLDFRGSEPAADLVDP
jgi:hypothetical protein